MMLTDEERQVYGLDSSRLKEYHQQGRVFLLQAEALAAFQALREDAAAAGFDLALVSSYRSFDRQLLIWNGKAGGQRPVLDADGQPMVMTGLSDAQRLLAILRWSAVPGLSRHHWGCDMDVYDAATMAAADVQLVPAEVNDGGPCAPLHDWLTERIQQNRSYGFFRPYSQGACDVAEEKWHLSYLPLARHCQALIDPDRLAVLWQEKQLLLLAPLLEQRQWIYRHYACLDTTRLPDWVARYR